MRQIVVIAHDIRSIHNVGSLMRTCEGLGINKIYLTGYTPFPKQTNDKRLPHLADKIEAQIRKTALGAENYLNWERIDNVARLVSNLKKQGYIIAGLEQSDESTALSDYVPPEKLVLVLGSEVSGIDQKLLRECQDIIEIPMLGKKESFNVVQAAAIALYHMRFYKK